MCARGGGRPGPDAEWLEELVGPIQDEFDRETPLITPLGAKVFEVDASCPLDVLAEVTGMEIPETDAETAGGPEDGQDGRRAPGAGRPSRRPVRPQPRSQNPQKYP